MQKKYYITIFYINISYTFIKFTFFNILLIHIPHKLDTLLWYTLKLHCLKAVCINVLYILCIGHLTDVPERTKQCGASNNL